MRRWPEILTILVLLAGIKLAIFLAPYAQASDVNVWIDKIVGARAHVIILIALLVACGFFGFWHRDPDGRIRLNMPRSR